MNPHPLQVTASVVRAILSGEQTQDRRPFKLLPDSRYPDGYDTSKVTKILPPSPNAGSEAAKVGWTPIIPAGEWPTPRKSPFAVGDTFYLSEAVRVTALNDEQYQLHYPADNSILTRYGTPELIAKIRGYKRPDLRGVTLPVAYARTERFVISEVRVERVKDISDQDAFAEGIGNKRQRESTWYPGKAAGMFRDLWASLYGIDSWENDWCWVNCFKRVTHQNESEREA